jgi:hypothetical protein
MNLSLAVNPNRAVKFTVQPTTPSTRAYTDVIGAFFAPPTSKSRAASRARPKINTNCFNTMCYGEYLNEK